MASWKLTLSCTRFSSGLVLLKPNIVPKDANGYPIVFFGLVNKLVIMHVRHARAVKKNLGVCSTMHSFNMVFVWDQIGSESIPNN